MALLLAVALDVAGMAALLTGVFAQLQVRGRDFGDLLIYTGALLVFLSLLGWILWYTGNIETAPGAGARLRPEALGARPPRGSSPAAGRRRLPRRRPARRARLPGSAPRRPHAPAARRRSCRVRPQLASLEAGPGGGSGHRVSPR